MTGLLFRLGKFSARRHWLMIIAWLVVLAIGGGAYSLFGGAISSAITIPGTQTAQTADLLAQKFPSASGGSGSVVFETTDGSKFTAAQKTAVAAFLKKVKTYDQVKSTTNPFTTQQQLDDARQKIGDGEKDIADGKQQLDDSQRKLDAGKKQLAAAQKQLDAQVSQAKAAGQYALGQAQFDAAQQQLDAQQKTLTANQQKIDDGQAKLVASAKTLALNKRLLALSKDFRLVAADGSAAVGSVSFTKNSVNAVDPAVKAKIVAAADDANIAGVRVFVSNEIAQGSINVLGPGEVTGLLVAAIVLFIMLSTVIGAALPLVSALLGIGVALLGALSFSSLVEFISVTPVLGVMLGLAVGIDYSLFILNRHRGQLKRGMGLHESIGLANGTSGNAVVFAGSTVIVALLALNVTGIPFLGLMGTVGAVAVAVAILIAVSFTPALLGIVGYRILRKRERAAVASADPHLRPVKPMRTWRAVVTLVAGVAALVLVALPALQMRLGLPDGSSEAISSTQYKAFDVVRQKFGAGQNGPLVVVAQLPKKLAGDDLTSAEVTLGEKIAAQGHVVSVVPVGASKDGTVVAYQIIPAGGPNSVSTAALVNDLRGLSPVATANGQVVLGVAGNASANIDVSQKLADVLPLYLVLVIGLSFLILILVFRSLLVPLTATLGFVLSLLATFGGLTAIYQFGWLGFIFGVHDPGPILSFLPIIEMGILFGLAMDYQLFLVSGMREAWAHGANPKLAVQQGFHAGRTVVIAAAIIMISVFSGFIFSDSSTIRPIGFGLAFGVLADAFIVRLLLIPAVMHLLGGAAWWFPKWLDRLLPNVDVEGAQLERSHPVVAPQPDSSAVSAANVVAVDPDDADGFTALKRALGNN